jgi:hypothetical protein
MRKGVCKNGHRLEGHNAETWEQKIMGADGATTFMVKRGCRRCRLKAAKKRRREAGVRDRARLLAPTRCPSGHLFTPENTIHRTQVYRRGDGNRVEYRKRQCRACKIQFDALYRERQRDRQTEARAA